MARIESSIARTAAVRGAHTGQPEYLKITAVRAVANGICGSVNGSAGFVQSGREVQRTAVHADHEGGAPGRIDQAFEAALVRARFPALRARYPVRR